MAFWDPRELWAGIWWVGEPALTSGVLVRGTPCPSLHPRSPSSLHTTHQQPLLETDPGKRWSPSGRKCPCSRHPECIWKGRRGGPSP